MNREGDRFRHMVTERALHLLKVLAKEARGGEGVQDVNGGQSTQFLRNLQGRLILTFGKEVVVLRLIT
jgi:hypothetical protein